MRKRYSRSYTVLSFLTMFSYRELPLACLFFIGASVVCFADRAACRRELNAGVSQSGF
jgi:hypothetical protein